MEYINLEKESKNSDYSETNITDQMIKSNDKLIALTDQLIEFNDKIEEIKTQIKSEKEYRKFLLDLKNE